MTDFCTNIQELFDLVSNDDVDAVVAKLEQDPEFSNAVNGAGSQTLLITAALCGSLMVLQELIKRNIFILNQADQDETTPLIAAAKGGYEECTFELLKCGADVTLKDKDGWGAVTWASYRGHSNIVKLLLDWKANPNEVENHGMIPLIWAAGRGHTNVVEELLKSGANPDSCDKYGTSALVWAARKGHVDIIKLLLKWNANVDKSGNHGWTPLIMSSKEGFENTVTLLIENGADVNALDQDNNSALVCAVKQGHAGIVRKLANHGAYINVRTKEGTPVLTLASKDCNVDIVRVLLDNYADVDALDQVGNTALWYAVEGGHIDVVRELLEFGAFTDATKKDGETPLLLAVKKKHSDITSLLLERNADLSATDKKGDTVLHTAVRCRFRRIVEIILKDPRSARLLYQTNRAGETPYRIDQRHKKSVLKPVIGMAECDRQHTEELLGHDVYTTSLAELLCEPSLQLPLTVGLYSRWGSSKTHFFKRLQQEMEEITQQTVRENMHFTWLGVSSCLLLCLALGVCFTAAFNWVIGVIVCGTVFVSCNIIYLVIITWENKCHGNRNPSWISEYVCRFFNAFHLSYLITFCVPPTLISVRSSFPVRFVFADFSKLTRSSCETTALVSMIETLNDIIEANYGCIASRLYRVLRPPMTDYMGTRHSRSQYKKCCCCLPKLCIFIFVFIYGAMSLVLYTIVGSSGSSVITSLQISGACIVGISLVVQSTTFCSVIYTLLFSPKRRVSIVATQLGLKEEGFIHALKQEVELLTELVISLDGFTKFQTRVILFIDGLDNSEQQKVLHLIDSINLLFTDPDAPFISLVAIDPRVTVRAIEQNFSNVLQDSHITALDYLKSIIHLPFFFPEPKLSVSGNLSDALRLSIEQLLRQRKTSGFELEWEGESFELMPGSSDKLKWKSNGAVSNNRHCTVLTIDQSHSDDKRLSARFTRSNIDIHCDKHEESPDLTHVLANNETLTPLGIQRLLHTTSLSGRLLRAKGFNFHWDSLASWVSLVDAWPYRMSWLVLIMEEFTNILPDNVPLKSLFTATHSWLPSLNGFDHAIDNDPMYFESFLGSHFPILKVEDLRRFLVGTINLDPAIRNQISQALQTSSNKTLNKVESTVTGGLGFDQSESTDLASLSEEDVCAKLSQIDGIQLTSVPSYQMIIRENHINGPVLLECDIAELRDVMEMNFGDWQLFKAWILKGRPQQTSNESGSLAWVDFQDRPKTALPDSSVEMGNISCVKSNSTKSRDDSKGPSRHGRSAKTTSIPRIVLDPGSTLSEQTQTGGDDEQESEVDVEKAHSGNKEWSIPNITARNEIRELYTITPRTDSSDEEGASENENTPLMAKEEEPVSQATSSQKSSDLPSVTADDSRPLLTRQVEMDEGGEQVIDQGCSPTECEPVSGTSSLNTTDEDYESQLPIPILFTVSPTKGGTSQIVSSVVATRDLSSALSRPLSFPTSPKSKSSKSSRHSKTPRSPKSPRSPRALRDFFNCRRAVQSPDNDVNENIEVSAMVGDKGNVGEQIPGKSTGEICPDDSDVTNYQTSKTEENNTTGEWVERPNVSYEPSSNGHGEVVSEDSIIVLEGCDVVPSMAPSCLRNSTQRLQGNALLNGSATDSSFEETANNSDKGYESVDNSPSVGNEDEQCSNSVRANGAVVGNKINCTTNPIWLPHMEESKALPQPTINFYSQTMV